MDQVSQRAPRAIRVVAEKLREGEAAKGVPVTSQVGRLRFEEARDDLINYHRANGRSTTKLEARIRKHLTPFFGGKKVADIIVASVNAYVAARLVQGRTLKSGQTHEVRPATINRELAWLKHMFNLAIEAGKLMTKPKIKLLKEHNARQGSSSASNT